MEGDSARGQIAELKSYFDSIPHERLMACVRMRVSDRSVLKLIRLWLEAPVVEPPAGEGGQRSVKRAKQGTPQGGVISPLLSNLYLHWFDRRFHRAKGPGCWARAKLVRYADDFVALARYVSPQLRGWIEQTLEGWMGLKLNGEKTRVVDLYAEGASPRQPLRTVNAYVRERLMQHLRRHRSQRAYRPVGGVSFYAHFNRLGLVSL